MKIKVEKNINRSINGDIYNIYAIPTTVAQLYFIIYGLSRIVFF